MKKCELCSALLFLVLFELHRMRWSLVSLKHDFDLDHNNSSNGDSVVVHVDLDLARNSSNGVVLQLPCMSHRLTKESFKILDYATSPLSHTIPRYSLNITVQTLEKCKEEVTVQANVEAMQSFLQTMCPLAVVSHQVSPAFSLGISSKLWGTPVSTIVPLDSAATAATATAATAQVYADISNVTTPTGTGAATTTSETSLAYSAPECNAVQGGFGHWSYNDTYANASWYIPEHWIRSNEVIHGPYNHSSWMYKSDIPSCTMTMLNLQGFCEAANALTISRLFVLGDSIEFMRLISFFHLMGIPSQVHKHLFRGMRYAYVFTQCPKPVELVFYRVNHLMAALGNESLTLDKIVDDKRYSAQQQNRQYQFEQRVSAEGIVDKRKSKEYYACYGIRKAQFPDEKGWCPWVTEYVNYDTHKGRTLLIAGVGPHFHQTSYFREQLDRFVHLLRNHVPRPNDIVWLRTVLEGHENCDDEKNPVPPLRSFQEFLNNYNSSAKRLYDWDQFSIYNQMMEMEIVRIQNDKDWKGPQFALLDIYWMTAMRIDGHPSPKDCLHYLLPGPPDWWNHLFYTNLRELAGLS